MSDNSSKNPTPSEYCFWGLSGQIVNAIYPYTEAHKMALLSQLLVVYGNMIGRQSHFLAEADLHAGNLFVVNVGKSAKGRKGTSWGWIEKIVQMIDSNWLKESVVNGFGSGEAIIWRLRDKSDVLDADSTSKKLLIMESEFGGLLRVINKEGNMTSPILRNGWDGKPLRNITKSSELVSTGHHISMIGHITKVELNSLLRQSEVMNGLGNRILFFFVERSKVLPFKQEMPSSELMMIVNELKDSINFAKQVDKIERSNEANKLWEKVYPKLSEGSLGLVGAMNSRAEAQVMRLALLISLLNKQKEISREALMCSLAIHDYTVQTLWEVFGSKTGDDFSDRLFDFISSQSNGVTRTQIRDFLNRNFKKGSIDSALEYLKDAGMVECRYIETAGRRIENWNQVNPDIIASKRRIYDMNDINDHYDQSSKNMSSMSSTSSMSCERGING